MISNNRLLVPILRQALQRRCQSVVSGPPTQHVSKTEKIVLGGGMIASLFIVPVWVLSHLKEYKGEA